jgi:ABC-type multidrug transport system fused ATPase/permease subunit
VLTLLLTPQVGVVGRTGSGKTTLLMALFRMFELAYGRIVIDGQNIGGLPLSEVRSRLAIIPQEPVMFKGSVRSNLDPFREATDAELWHALEMVHMKEVRPPVCVCGGVGSSVGSASAHLHCWRILQLTAAPW